MIIDVNQTKRQPKPEYTIFDSITSEVLGSAKAYTYEDTTATYCGEDFKFDFHKEIVINQDGRKIRKFHIRSVNSEIGIVEDFTQTRKVLFVPIGFSYYRIQINNEEYLAYEVGFGNDKHYFSVFHNDSVVAMIQKYDRVIDYKDSYTVFIDLQQPAELAKALTLFTVFIDCSLYADVGEVSGTSDDATSFNTVQKELNDKYDPTFIQRVMEQHGVSES